MHSSLALSGASSFRMKVFSEAFDLLSVVSVREECRPKESGHPGGNHSLAPTAAPRVGEVAWVMGGLPPLRSGPLKGLKTLSKQTYLILLKPTGLPWYGLCRSYPVDRMRVKGSFW